MIIQPRWAPLSAATLAFMCAVAAAADTDPLQPPTTQVTTPATTQEVETVFKALDRDDDQLISRQEAARERSLKKRFDAVDSSGDGYLSRAEYEARPTDEPFE
jgi:Ca2+-binding EF-hand superfamily protein